VRVQGVALEDHGDVAVLGRLVVDDLAPDAQLTRGDVLQAGDHVEGGGLAAAGGADEDDELPVGNVQIEVIDREGAIGKTLGKVLQHDFGHCVLLKSRIPG